MLVLQSLRRPKRIKIIGHDEKEYSFLVKGGEDLRLDQRIEQARLMDLFPWFCYFVNIFGIITLIIG